MKIALSIWNKWTKDEQEYFKFQLINSKYFAGVKTYQSFFREVRKHKGNEKIFMKKPLHVNIDDIEYYFSMDYNKLIKQPF